MRARFLDPSLVHHRVCHRAERVGCIGGPEDTRGRVSGGGSLNERGHPIPAGGPWREKQPFIGPDTYHRLVHGPGVRPKDRVGASVDTVREANAIIESRTDWGLAQRLAALAIVRLESDFGVSGSWLMIDGSPSYNWGALTGSGTAGSISHGDNAPDGTPVTYNFQAFHNPAEAFDSFRRTWTRGNVSGDKDIPHERTVEAAAARGDAYNVAKTMYAHRYYGGTPSGAGAWHPSMGSDDERRIQTYAKAIVGSAAVIASQLGVKSPLFFEVAPPKSEFTIGAAIVPAAIGGVLAGAGLALGAGPVGAVALGVTPLALWWARSRAA